METVRPAERRYELLAYKRNKEEQKYQYYTEIAKYFERETRKAKQFNAWNVDELKQTHWENVRKRESLKARQNKLQELVRNEEKQYEEECEKLKKSKNSKNELSLDEWKKQLIERRAELNLYNPRTSRRLQTYFLYPTNLERQPLKELNKSFKNNTKLSEKSESTIKSVKMTEAETNFQERSDAFLENQLNSLSSQFKHFYDDEKIESAGESKKIDETEENNLLRDDKPSSPSPNKRSNQNILFGNQTYLSDENTNSSPDKKYKERYSHRSLNHTNVSSTVCTHSFGLSDDTQRKQNSPDKIRLMEAENRSEIHENEETGSKSDGKTPSIKQIYPEESNKNNNTDEKLSEQLEDASLGESDKVDGSEDQKADDNLIKEEFKTTSHGRSEMMLMYLDHRELKRKIGDLEMRERRAVMKHLWEDTLRLRDMRNRLELLWEKQIYQRDDLMIDPQIKMEALDNIEKRSKQLESRSHVCENSNMYSEEAKANFDQWIQEDEKSIMKNYGNVRDVLLKQLEDDWLKLREDEKINFLEIHKNIMSGSSMQMELQLLAKRGIA